MSSTNEIAQIDQINKALTNLNSTLDQTSAKYLTIVKNINDSQATVKLTVQTQENLNKAQKETADTTQKLDALGKQLQASEQKLKQTEDERLKTIIQNKIATTEATKAVTDKVKAEGLAETSLVRMRQKLAEMTAEYDKSAVRSKEAADAINKLSKEIGKAEEATNRGQRSVGQYGKVWDGIKSLLPIATIAGAIAGLKGLVTNIIDVRKEFEKYEAVLTNTLGSSRAARTEMQMLQRFAAETPFQLTELTGAFVKLTNYGLKPNKDELTKYGDIASSVGKGFDQLVEGIADAVTGQFERLKEFGIKASQEGDKVSFTFKGQKTVVDNNADSIKNYILSLGKLEGVQGSMAAISATLGGRISNMGDAWDNLMNTMGAGSSGVMITVINWMTSFIDMLSVAWKSIKQIKEEVRDKSVTEGMNNAVQEIDVMTKSLVKNGVNQAEAHKRAVMLYNQSIESTIESTKKAMNSATGEEKAQLEKRLNLMIDEKQAVKEHFTALDKIKQPKSESELKKENEKRIKEIEISEEKEKILINQKLISRTISEEQHKKLLEDLELKFLAKKQAIYAKDSKEWSDFEIQKQNIAIKTQQEITKEKEKVLKEEEKLADEGMKDFEASQKEQNKIEEQFINESLKNGKEVWNEKKKLDDDEKKRKTDNAKAIRDIQVQMAKDVINFVFESNNQKFAAELDQLNKEKDAKLKNTHLTAAQKASIEAEYAKKEAAIKTKQAQNDKTKALFDIAINTAVAVMANAKNPIMVPWVIALGLLEAALVAARPIPKFATGTKDAPRRGIFGEAGMEVMFPKGGGAIFADKPTYFEGDKFKGAEIYSNTETKKLMSLVGDRNIIVKNQHDPKLLDQMKRIEKAIVSKPVAIYDENHRQIGLGNSVHQTIYLNRLTRNN